MKLIIGLGNPGKEYQQTRHNVGFLVVNKLSSSIDSLFSISKMLNAEVAKNESMILAKPLTFMNNSGEAVAKIIKNYKLKTENLYVVHDDLDIPLGEYKSQLAKGPKVHNGILSIEQHIKTDQFTRVRVGVDNRDPDNRIPGEAYVLQNFTDDEIVVLEEVIKKIVVELMSDH